MAASSEIHPSIDADTFTTYSDALQAAALSTTQLAATSLPADLSFYRSIDPAFARDVDALSNRVLALLNKLVHVANGKKSRMREEEDVSDEFVRNILDPMEGMLESTDSALDVFLGKRKDPEIHVPAVPVDPHQKKPKKQLYRGRLDPVLTHAHQIPKPQLLFKHTPSNIDESPYIPAALMLHKWCAKVPLGYVFHDEISERDVREVHEDTDEEGRKTRMLHPYYYELTHPSYPDYVFNPPAKPSLPPSLSTPPASAPTAFHPLTFISTPEAFFRMANAISSEMELAIDLEHHSYRSYKGFLALMQISTRQADFVVDLLVPEIREGLRQAKGKSIGGDEGARMASDAGQIIARILADPSIIKVFHGAESDIIWLQQDFNIFVVGLFDTYHASKLLEFPKYSLAHLLETYCDFVPDKRYQLADWRIRPLPAEMLTYARSDTHFLLYTYDVLRLLLIERASTDSVMADEPDPVVNTQRAHRGHSLIRAVLNRSARTALRLYNNGVYDAEGGTGSNGWDTLARKWNKVALVGSSTGRGTEIQGSQTTVYRAVHRWRENVAREEDDSTRYVLSTHHLFLLAEYTPTAIPDLLSLFNGPGGVKGGVPPVLKHRAGELVAVIRDATEPTKSTSSLQGLSEDRREGSKMVISTVIEELERVNPKMFPSSATKSTHESRLWTLTPLSASTQQTSVLGSSLFGVGLCGGHVQNYGVTTLPSVDGERIYLARESVLFGSALTESAAATSFRTSKSTSTCTNVLGESAERFKDLMEKIHKTLVIAPVVSAPSASVETQTLETPSLGVPVDSGDKPNSAILETSDIPSGPVGQIEIPFIPAHKRQTIPNCAAEDDTVIVVGQAGRRQQKRKRDKARAQSNLGTQFGGVKSSAQVSDHDQEVEEFDYSSVPNLLDDESKNEDTGVHERDEKRRKKQRRGQGMPVPSYDLRSQRNGTPRAILAWKSPRLRLGTRQYQ